MEKNKFPIELQSKFLGKEEFVGEVLDFSELNDLKGKGPDKPPTGRAGGLVCWCSGMSEE